jgi:hypothetical protein
MSNAWKRSTGWLSRGATGRRGLREPVEPAAFSRWADGRLFATRLGLSVSPSLPGYSMAAASKPQESRSGQRRPVKLAVLDLAQSTTTHLVGPSTADVEPPGSYVINKGDPTPENKSMSDTFGNRW